MKILLVTNIVAPYRVPVFNALARTAGIELEVVTLARMEGNRKWSGSDKGFEFKRVVLPGVQIRGRRPDRIIHFNAGLFTHIRRHRPDALIVGSMDQVALLEGLVLGRTLGIPTTLWSGANSDATGAGRIGSFVKRQIVRLPDSFVTYGTAATRHLVELGASPDRIVTSRNAVDVSRFRPEPYEEASHTLRERLVPDDACLVLATGQLIRRKGFDTLIEAVGRLPDAHLVVVGSGPDRSELEALGKRVCPAHVTFVGHVAYDELPVYYASADVFVMPSRTEVWGLVLNEAMAARLPVVASAKAGASLDLIEEGVTGYTFDPENVASLVRALEPLIESRALRESLGQACGKLIEEVTPGRYANDMVEAVFLARQQREKTLPGH